LRTSEPLAELAVSGPLADALQGIRVLDLSRLLPGPYLTMVLADMGADVIKVEDPKLGDYLRSVPPLHQATGMSGRYLAVNRGKRSIALDLKDAAARDAFLAMVRKCDVVVESFRPGVMDKLGLSYATLAGANPGIIVCSISGYGQTGPYAERAGHDLNYIATAGVLAMTGSTPGGPPVLPGVQIADIAGGALWGATAILGALVGRHRTGNGAHLDISMTEGALALLAAELGNLSCGLHPSRSTEALNGALAIYGVYRCKDDRYLAVGALEPKFWLALNTAIGRPPNVAEIVGDAAQQTKVRADLEAIFATRTAAEWATHLADHDCCVEIVLEVDELSSHPLHQSRGVFFTIGDGDIPQIRTPLGTPSQPKPPPRHGEHTAEVLAEFGVRLG
jgi:crotonobetainyl-CoA:carnitine CoA-transferase CaiB-like acyl-CoA transferase